MYVQKVTLSNIRGFEHLDFDLTRPDGSHAGWTVFTGDNGSGTSALLKAIAVGLVGRDTARSLQPSFHRWIRHGSGDLPATIELEIVRTQCDDDLVEPGRAPGTSFPAKLQFKNGGRETTLEAVVPSGRQNKYQTPHRSIWAADARGWFSCGYGPFRRIFGSSPEATRLMVAPATERFVTMFQEAASLAEVDQWLRSLKHKELENRTAERDQLDALMNVLNDDLMPNQIRVSRVDSDGLWLVDRHGVELSWAEMSDGYRSSLALLADIVRHLVGAFGFDGSTSKDELGHTTFVRSGVVLIDEIDAHLHPEWQREIGFWLKRHFPNIQFLVTTHSPLICQAADPGGLFHLPEPGSEEPPRRLTAEEHQRVIASRPDSILLGPAFGLQNTRSPLAVENRREHARLASKQRSGAGLSDEEATRLEQLELFTGTDEEV